MRFEGTLSVLLMLLALDLRADSRRITEYGYDRRGDVTNVYTEVSDQAPVVTELAPSILRIGRQHAIVANGLGLRKVQIVSDSPNLIFSGIQSDHFQARFTIEVGEGASLGGHTLNFSTSLGTVAQTITVHPPLPVITLNPAPIVLPVSGVAVELDIQLSGQDLVAHSLDLSVGDSNIAQLQTSTLTIAAGETRPNVTIRIAGLQKGASTLNLTSPTLDPFTTRLFVTDPYSPAIGNHGVFAAPLGVFLGGSLTPPPLPVRGPFQTQLGILKPQSAMPGQINVDRLVSQSLMLGKGAVLFGVDQSALIADGPALEVTVFGTGLESVERVAILPPDGITIGPLSIAPDGSFVRFSVIVDPGAANGSRRIVLSFQNGDVLSLDPRSAQIAIARAKPEIQTIAPIVVTRLSTTDLVIRGHDLESADSLAITPSAGITIAQPIRIDPGGTEVGARISVDEFAPLGDRVVSVATAAGTTSDVASPANTLTVINGPAKQIGFLIAPVVGVDKSIDPSLGFAGVDIRNPSVGVVRDSHVGNLIPGSQPIGSDFILTVRGSGLAAVDSISFIPGDDLFVGIPTVASDGLSLTVPVSIDFNAQKTVRQVRVQAQNFTIQASPAGADRFQVTDLEPIITSLSPNYLVAGDNFIQLQIRGKMLDGVTSVSVVPGDDLLVGPAWVDPQGTLVTVDISAGLTARTGPRLVVVQTTSDQSSTLPTPANTLEIVAIKPPAFNALVSAPVGVDKPAAGAPAPQVNRSIHAPLVGVVNEPPPPAGQSRNNSQHAGALGLLIGSSVTGVSPHLAPIGARLTLTVDGFGLDRVTALSLNPPDGVLLTDNITINGNGTGLTVPVEVAADAPLTVREIVLSTANGKFPFVKIEDSRLTITGLLPIIESIHPIQQFPGTTQTLTVRGLNLNNTVSIEAIPQSGIQFGIIQVDSAGTQLQVPMAITSGAPSGPRVIVVTTVAGTSDFSSTPANTFTVLPLP
ncbi:MAG: hypothetical protein ACRERU_04450 [Methylococcales bacterium]